MTQTELDSALLALYHAATAHIAPGRHRGQTYPVLVSACHAARRALEQADRVEAPIRPDEDVLVTK